MFTYKEMEEAGKQAISKLELPEGAKLAFLAVGGSYAYGTAHEESDLDLRGIFIEPKRKFLTLEPVRESVNMKEPDMTLYEIGKFYSLAANGNPNILEILYSTYVLHMDDAIQETLLHSEIFLSQRLKLTYGGYAKSQLGRLLKDERHGRLTQARRDKHLLHCMRLLHQGIETLATGHLTNLVSNADVLKEKTQGMTNDEAVVMFEQLIPLLDHVPTRLPEDPDYGAINDMLLRAREAR